MVQLLWRTVWRFLKKIKIELAYDPTPGQYYLQKTIIQKDIFTSTFTAALFTISKTWKQLKFNRGTGKEDVLHIYNEILLSHRKEWNNSIAATWLDLEFIILSVVSQRKTNIVITYMWNLKKWYNRIYLQNRNSRQT